jgi:hypothetical protein
MWSKAVCYIWSSLDQNPVAYILTRHFIGWLKSKWVRRFSSCPRHFSWQLSFQWAYIGLPLRHHDLLGPIFHVKQNKNENFYLVGYNPV